MNWIPCSERLPEEKYHQTSFLVFDQYGIDVKQFNVKGTYKGFNWREDQTVTHWMELPTPPTETKEK